MIYNSRPYPYRQSGGGEAEGFELLPAGVELREFFLGGFEVVGELVDGRGVLAEIFGVGEQALDARNLGLDGVDLRFHAGQLAGFFEGEFARLGLRGGG